MSGRSLAYALVGLGILLGLVAGPLGRPPAANAAAPRAPVNLSPVDGATGISLTVTLRASEFRNGEGDRHTASKWQIGSREITVSSGDLTAFQVPPGLLDYSTSYAWRVSYAGSNSEWSAWSSAWSFTTVGPPSQAPQVTTGQASAIGASTATLNGDLADTGTAASVSVSFQWGTSGDYGETAPAGTMTAAGGFSAGLTGLSPGTAYRFRAVAAGAETVYGAGVTFATSPAPPPPADAGTGAAPYISSLMAYGSPEGQAVTVKITGAHLGGATRVDFGEGIEGGGLAVQNDREIMGQIIVLSGAEVAREVRVTTPSGAAVYPLREGFLAGLALDGPAGEEGPGRRWWVFLAVAGGLVGVGLLAALEVGLWRHLSGEGNG